MNLNKALINALKSQQEIEINRVFELIYNEYSKLVYFIISGYIKTREDIEDLTNDVFINFFNNLSKINLNIKYYLTISAKNAALNYLKKQKNIIDLNDEFIINYPDFNTGNSNLENLISVMKDYVDELEIEIILLHTIYDYTFKEISEKLNKPLNTVLTQYHRALKKLRRKKIGKELEIYEKENSL